MKKIIVFMLIVLAICISGCDSNNDNGNNTTEYPEEIIWGTVPYSYTGTYYSENDYNYINVGDKDGHDIFRIDNDSLFAVNSIFIKTDEGYVRYATTTYTVAKPAVYLYPRERINVNIKLDFDGMITCSYPEYNDGWNIIAESNGKLIDIESNEEYDYLFWEGECILDINLSYGFVVKGEDTADFLKEKLAYMGLEASEYNDFIVYWLPQMVKNKYNLIAFLNEEYSNKVKLDIEPEPDSVIRIYMVYKGLKEKIKIDEPELEQQIREGFTVVEWGGSCID